MIMAGQVWGNLGSRRLLVLLSSSTSVFQINVFVYRLIRGLGSLGGVIRSEG